MRRKVVQAGKYRLDLAWSFFFTLTIPPHRDLKIVHELSRRVLVESLGRGGVVEAVKLSRSLAKVSRRPASRFGPFLMMVIVCFCRHARLRCGCEFFSNP